MSVLARPQGVPERVWSLVSGLDAIGKRADRTTYEALINPSFVKDGVLVRTKAELARDVSGAASSLGLIQYDRSEVSLSASFASEKQFADYLHDYLAKLDPNDSNSVILQAYAWLVAESDRQGGASWIYELDRKAFADQANAALAVQDEDGRPMNDTKVVAWRRWLVFLGLGVPLPLPNAPDFPSPASRIGQEIRRAEFPPGVEIAAAEFLSKLAERMPYLDGGSLYKQACQRIGHVPRRGALSPLLSAALWDLHEQGAVTLRPRGDSSDAVRLSSDATHAIQTFNLVIVHPVEVN